ncbi:MAG: hypothetical protein ACTHLK_23145 [Brucella intermedia]
MRSENFEQFRAMLSQFRVIRMREDGLKLFNVVVDQGLFFFVPYRLAQFANDLPE